MLAENAASSSGMGVHHNPNDVVVPAAFNAMTHVTGVQPDAVADMAEDGDDIEMTNENASDEEERKF